jgi:hypothetical protein
VTDEYLGVTDDFVEVKEVSGPDGSVHPSVRLKDG